jgi:hypothetical protein
MAPIIRPLDSQSESTPTAAVLSLSGGPRHHFVVMQPGELNGSTVRQGDVLVVGGRARPGDAVVLLARGMGRPRVGSMAHDGLRGDAGEPCSAARWVPAGRLLEVVRSPPQALPVQGGQLSLEWGACAA